MYYTGVDWSGDPGIPSERSASSTQIVFAFVTIGAGERDHLHEVLEALRRKHRKTSKFIFHYVDCPTDIANAFFDSIGVVEFQMRIGIVDKGRDWTTPDIAARKGHDRLIDALVSYAALVPPPLVSGSILLIEAPKSERKFGLSVRRAIRAEFGQQGRECFRDIRPSPDGNNPDGEVIQVADMVAGAVRRAGVVANPQIRMLERRLENWHEVEKENPTARRSFDRPAPYPGDTFAVGKNEQARFQQSNRRYVDSLCQAEHDLACSNHSAEAAGPEPTLVDSIRQRVVVRKGRCTVHVYPRLRCVLGVRGGD